MRPRMTSSTDVYKRQYQNNLDATLTLCKVMAKHNVKRIIFSSSATVYSGDNEMPLRETSKTGNCTNPYGCLLYTAPGEERKISVIGKDHVVSEGTVIEAGAIV